MVAVAISCGCEEHKETELKSFVILALLTTGLFVNMLLLLYSFFLRAHRLHEGYRTVSMDDVEDNDVFKKEATHGGE